MKHLIYFLLLFFYFPSFAEDCASQVPQYVIRGDLTSKYPGARLWRLAQVKKNLTQKKTCAKEIYDRAFQESNEYWDYIDKKYSCGIFSEGTESSKCSEELQAKVVSNKAYLAMMKMDGLPSDDCTYKRGTNTPLGSRQIKNVKDLSSVVATQIPVPGAECDDVPEKDKIPITSNTSPASDLVEAVSKGLGSCFWGLLKGFFQEGIFKSLSSIWDTLADPWGILESMKVLAKDIIIKPKETMAKLVQAVTEGLYQKYAARYEKFDCYNSAKKSEVLCSSIGNGAAGIVEAIFGAKAFKAGSQILKKLKTAPKGTGQALEGEFIKAPKKLPGPQSGKTGSTLDGEFKKITDKTNPSISKSSDTLRIENNSNPKDTKLKDESSSIPERITIQKTKSASSKPEPKEAPATPPENKVKQEIPPSYSRQDAEELVSRYKKFGTISDASLLKYLKLSPDAKKQDKIKALRIMQQRLHPDKTVGDPEAEKLFKTINEIYKNVKKQP